MFYYYFRNIQLAIPNILKTETGVHTMPQKDRIYAAIDLKSFYASVDKGKVNALILKVSQLNGSVLGSIEDGMSHLV